MRILIFGLENIRLLSNIFNFDDHKIVFLVKNDEKDIYNDLIEKCELILFNFNNFSDIDFSTFDHFDLFIVSSSKDNLNSLFIHRLDQIYPEHNKFVFIKDSNFAELQRDFGFNVLSTDELLRGNVIDILGG
tara:strand:- start:43 stop:438 length:396 start_codon:yes stop_codon:yes gene_type:complete